MKGTIRWTSAFIFRSDMDKRKDNERSRLGDRLQNGILYFMDININININIKTSSDDVVVVVVVVAVVCGGGGCAGVVVW
ncbi:Hypothetical predicted protein [Octopus vulgaris]|uniref:Transmembrane protein n=1 Tax=Octopus vulgaris TaxID=6645 RepID=A0AA36BG06_OCTVU|nr:Hypothetical predicted protein [Octopus vulgaris]